jgi:hypothetical protein
MAKICNVLLYLKFDADPISKKGLGTILAFVV